MRVIFSFYHSGSFHNSFWSHLFLSISWGLINLNLASVVPSWSDSSFIPSHSDNCGIIFLKLFFIMLFSSLKSYHSSLLPHIKALSHLYSQPHVSSFAPHSTSLYVAPLPSVFPFSFQQHISFPSFQILKLFFKYSIQTLLIPYLISFWHHLVKATFI